MQRNFEDDISVEHLMRLAQPADHNAYARLFQEFTPIMRAFVGKILGRGEYIENNAG